MHPAFRRDLRVMDGDAVGATAGLLSSSAIRGAAVGHREMLSRRRSAVRSLLPDLCDDSTDVDMLRRFLTTPFTDRSCRTCPASLGLVVSRYVDFTIGVPHTLLAGERVFYGELPHWHHFVRRFYTSYYCGCRAY